MNTMSTTKTWILKCTRNQGVYVSSIVHDAYLMTSNISKAERLTENEAKLHVINTTFGPHKLFQAVAITNEG